MSLRPIPEFTDTHRRLWRKGLLQEAQRQQETWQRIVCLDGSRGLLFAQFTTLRVNDEG